MSETNPFGGKNPFGLYVPLTDIELEALERIALAGEFKVVIKDWGYITNFTLGRYDPTTWDGKPLVVFGDKRISFYFFMDFTAPAIPQPNWYFDMEVWAMGHKLFPTRAPTKDNPYPGRHPTQTGGKPIQIAAGMSLGMAFDLALDQIDPAIVKEVMPKTTGLTTRHGNMKLDREHQRLFAELQKSERAIREMTAEDAVKITEKMKKDTGR